MFAATDAKAVTVAPMLPLGTNGIAEASMNGKKEDRNIMKIDYTRQQSTIIPTTFNPFTPRTLN